ncbi:Uncharacterized protein FKW44_002835, partial [Caligus rogercresseyi]
MSGEFHRALCYKRWPNFFFSLYYYTFVDLLDYRDHVGELLTTLDACGIVMDITRNLSKAYLNVVSTYASLEILLSPLRGVWAPLTSNGSSASSGCVLYTHHTSSPSSKVSRLWKKVKEVKDFQNAALQTLQCCTERAIISPLRSTGNSLFIFMASASRGRGALAHAASQEPPARQTSPLPQEGLIDRFFPELLFLMGECRALVKKYGQVIQRCYVQYLSGYDAVALNKSIQSLMHISEEDSIILSSIFQTISDLNVEQVVDTDHLFDFRGLRLDWKRLKSYTSSSGSNLLRNFGTLSVRRSIPSPSIPASWTDWKNMLRRPQTGAICLFKLFEDHFQIIDSLLPFPYLRSLFPERHESSRKESELRHIFLDEMSKEARTLSPPFARSSEPLQTSYSQALLDCSVATRSESYRKTREDLITRTSCTWSSHNYATPSTTRPPSMSGNVLLPLGR